MIAAHFDEHAEVVQRSAAEAVAVAEAITDLLARVLAAGGKVLVCGNGGSAADAQHFASELVGRFERTRAGLPALALSVDSSLITAVANDLGFEAVFARQVETWASPADVLVALSTSGRSPNVVAAARSARAIGCPVVALTGAQPSELGALADVHLAVASDVVARVQEVHGLVLHAIAAELEAGVRSDGAP